MNILQRFFSVPNSHILERQIKRLLDSGPQLTIRQLKRGSFLLGTGICRVPNSPVHDDRRAVPDRTRFTGSAVTHRNDYIERVGVAATEFGPRL